MGDHAEDRLLADGPLADERVAVLMGANGIHAVVDVDRLEKSEEGLGKAYKELNVMTQL